ncbi:hypothetical protein ACLMJK_003572 [Lecanora helva]
MTEINTTYNDLQKLNPFHDERYTQLKDFYDFAPTNDTMDPERPPVPAKPVKKGHQSPGMSHSLSENNIDIRAPPTNAHNLRVGKTFALPGDNHVRLSDESTDSSFSRGRGVTRTPSPVKLLEDIKEDQSPDAPIIPPKRSRSPMKQLFGERGWLGKSTSFKELPDEEYRKKGLKHWGGKIKQRVEDFTGDVTKFVPTTVYHHKSPSKSPSRSKFHVSLDPPMQAKLYSEIELMICATANQYLNVQQQHGRMSVESLTKVVQWWASKNRPQVIEFMFDQATQRDLVLYNIKTFRFYGANANDVVSMNTMMQSWKTLAKEMSIRTFCTPDIVIKKQMHDLYKILEMLGAPLVTFLAFQEIQVKALRIMEDEQQKKKDYQAVKFGIERRWEPPTRSAQEIEELEKSNPFA